ncbi:pectate lyase-like [Durio zibethinus]|uniref:Pectate lyase n=1 Tax=Durio zibethinus TaxID=66656 RepID=A0A6P5ZHE2_DURZI|nr:pectate lyase-like [Durio zibethinus]
MEVNKLRLVFFFSFAALIPSLWANIAEFDDVWKPRAEEAWKNTLAAYEPNPENVTSNLNYNVNKAMAKASSNKTMEFEGVSTNSTRRNLRGKHKTYTGPCMGTNPIDRCWRCDKNWAKNRKKLANCVLGFGHKTQGGKTGKYYRVTDNSDDNVLDPRPGTLRHAVIQKKPLWIIFSHDMNIKLSQELIVQSKKTIDGRGANVHIAYGAGITLQFVDNVIIHNIHIHHIVKSNGGLIRDSVDHYGLRTVGDGDGVSIFGSTNIWLDHLSMSECQDGLIDAIQGSTAITISNCHFTHHNDVILLGASDTYARDKLMQVTVAFNHFGKELIQRMPRCRWGFFHVVNNDYTHWKMYAIGGSMHPTIISQGNRFIAPDDPKAKEITNRNYAPESEWSKWVWRSEGDLFMNGAFFRTSGPPAPPRLNFNKLQMIKAKPASFVRRLTRFAGALNCKKGFKC